MEEAKAGDIVGLVGLKESFTGDTLGAENSPIIFEKIVFPEPVVSVAVEPRRQAEQEKVFYGLSKLVEEDPTVRMRVDEETKNSLATNFTDYADFLFFISEICG